jgi:integrase
MTRRRVKPRGSIQPWKQADQWRVRLTFGPGQRWSRVVIGSKKDAEAVLQAQIARKFKGEEAPRTQQTVAAWIDEYIASHTKGVGQRTRDGYASYLARYVTPTLGTTPLGRLTRHHITDWARTLRGQKDRTLSPRTVRQAYTVLSTCLQAAVDDERMGANPCIRSKQAKQRLLPSAPPLEARAFTADEVGRLLAKSAATPWGPLWALMADAGVRPAEAYGIQWSDIDEHGVLVVKRSLLRPKGAARRGEPSWVFGPTKVKRQRGIPLGVDTRAVLDKHKRYIAAMRLAAGPRWQDHDLVFPGPRGAPIDPQAMGVAWKKAVAAAKVPYLPARCLRHTCGTLVRAAGGDLKDASERLGHASIAITAAYYSAAVTERQQTTADRLAALRAAHRPQEQAG